MIRLSALARNLTAETAFTVLALARNLKAQGKDVVELEIGDSPFPSTPHAKAAGIQAIEENQTGYCPSLGLPRFREAAAAVRHLRVRLSGRAREHRGRLGGEAVRAVLRRGPARPRRRGPGLQPAFPDLRPQPRAPRGARRAGAAPGRERVPAPGRGRQALPGRPIPRPRAIFLNSPHNPTGGVATRDDLAAIADVVRGTELMVFSDEPYCHMVWEGRHESILAEPGMLEHTVAAYTFSKSYSMSGWRIGFAVAHPDVVEAIGKLINTTASCSPPLAQWAAQAALEHDAATRDDYMGRFRRKVERLCAGLRGVDGLRVVPPGRDILRLPRRRGPSATGWASPRTAWRSTCSKGPTTPSASPAWAASASARPAAASSASVAPSPTNGSTRPSRSSPRPSPATDRVRLFLEANPQFVLREPYRGRLKDGDRPGSRGVPHRPGLVVHLLVHRRGRRLHAHRAAVMLLIPLWPDRTQLEVSDAGVRITGSMYGRLIPLANLGNGRKLTARGHARTTEPRPGPMASVCPIIRAAGSGSGTDPRRWSS